MQHSHEHHSHEHHHEHNGNSSGGDLDLRKLRWEAVDRFKSRKGREPTEEELNQILDHGHVHEHLSHPGTFSDRDSMMADRNYATRAFTIGIGGPVGTGVPFIRI